MDFVSEQMMRRVTILYDEKSDHFVFERMIETEEWSFCFWENGDHLFFLPDFSVRKRTEERAGRSVKVKKLRDSDGGYIRDDLNASLYSILCWVDHQWSRKMKWAYLGFRKWVWQYRSGPFWSFERRYGSSPKGSSNLILKKKKGIFSNDTFRDIIAFCTDSTKGIWFWKTRVRSSGTPRLQTV